MRTAKIIAWIGFICMTIGILYALVFGQFGVEGSRLLSMSWGIVSMIDLYSGFILFSGWIIYREKSKPLIFMWVLLMMLLGFWTGCLYSLIALYQAKGDWKKFWLGYHHQT